MRRADARKFHYIYKISRDDGFYYIGLHSTDNLDDGYFGSGTRLSRSIRKHGKDRHSKEILEFCEDRKSLKSREKELVNEETLKDAKCLNLKLGGEGGWDAVSNETRARCAKIAGARTSFLLKNCENYRNARRSMVIATVRKNHSLGLHRYDNFSGKSHSEETKERMRNSHKNLHHGEKNSQFGTRWIVNLNTAENKKISKGAEIPIGWICGRKMISK